MIMINKKTEVGYNFDFKLIDFITNNNYQNYISSIYVAPFKEDYWGSTRKVLDSIYAQSDRKIYESHIKYILSNNLNINILFQNKKHILTKEILEYYINLGVTSFTVNNDDTAKFIKNYNSNLEVIASITKKLSYSDFINKDLSMYDKFVLFFPFNRSLETIKKLPKQYKYILIINSPCGYRCEATWHWETEYDENGMEIFLPGLKCQSSDQTQQSLLFVNTLSLFDPYIYEYKIQGRELLTSELINDINEFITRKLIFDFRINCYNKNVIPQGIENYYNVATNDSIYLK